MKMNFSSHTNKSHLHKKGFALILQRFESESFWNSEMAYCFVDLQASLLEKWKAISKFPWACVSKQGEVLSLWYGNDFLF